MQTPMRVTNVFVQLLGMLVPVVSALVGTGMIANDVDSHWLRTLAIRSITLEEYYLSKLAASFATTWIVVLPSAVFPLIIRIFTVSEFQSLDVLKSVAALFIAFGTSLTYLTIMAYLSSRVSGFYNLAALITWAFGAVSLDQLVRMRYASTPWMSTVTDLLFPSGFSNATDLLMSAGVSPLIDILWGIAALLFFAALGLHRITKIPVEGGNA
jgi:ABC-type transport system involved in multi-copper enzyme maturation permease subunit